MPIPSSGPISFEMIRAEFGGTTPITLSQYYRGAGLVPDSAGNIAIPLSGPISASDFYGATNSDLVPNAVNWSNIFHSYSAFRGSSGTPNWAYSNTQTISGIDSPIVLRFTPSEVSAGLDEGGIQLRVLKNGIDIGEAFTSPPASGGSVTPGAVATASFMNNDTLQFQFIIYGRSSSTSEDYVYQEKGCRVDVINTSNANTTLDLFYCNGSYTDRWSGGGGNGPPELPND